MDEYIPPVQRKRTKGDFTAACSTGLFVMGLLLQVGGTASDGGYNVKLRFTHRLYSNPKYIIEKEAGNQIDRSRKAQAVDLFIQDIQAG